MVEARSDVSVRERLLAAANELFYEEGVHTVGIDRVLERAGVAKASLYGTFGSKEELVRAYLERRAVARRERISARIAQHEHSRDRILSIFDLLAETAAEANFRGCAFVSACAEGPRGPTPSKQVAAEQRAWVRSLLTQLARDFGALEPAKLGRQLAVLYDGALIGARMDSDPGVVRDARAIAECLLDTQAGAKASTPRGEPPGGRARAATKARAKPARKWRPRAS
jgi:AcrR family transcriptional regulator